MKKIIYILLAIIHLNVYTYETDLKYSNDFPKIAITCSFNLGRLGDHLLTYIKAKYLSIRYHLSLLYKPFEFSSFFTFDTKEPLLFDEKTASQLYKQTIYLNNTDDIHPKISNSLYVSSLKTKIKKNADGSFTEESISVFLDFIKRNSRFAHFVRHWLTPIKPLNSIKPPTDTLNIAVHVRKGDGYDGHLISPQYDDPTIQVQQLSYEGEDTDYYSDVRHPKRFPREQYYVNQILLLAKLFPHKKLYIQLFTDSRTPQVIVNRFIRALKLPPSRFTIHFQQYTDNAPIHIIEDLFNMTQFDYLIRPSSSFSKSAQLIGDFKLTISPNTYVWRDKVLIMDTVQITYYKDNKTRMYSMPSYNNDRNIDEIKNILFYDGKNRLS